MNIERLPDDLKTLLRSLCVIDGSICYDYMAVYRIRDKLLSTPAVKVKQVAGNVVRLPSGWSLEKVESEGECGSYIVLFGPSGWASYNAPGEARLILAAEFLEAMHTLLSAPVVKAGEVPEYAALRNGEGLYQSPEWALREVQYVWDMAHRAGWHESSMRSFSKALGILERFFESAKTQHASPSVPVVKAEQLAAGQVPDALTFLQDNDLAASGDWQQGWNDCRSFFAAPVPSTVGQEWQPIETAPKALLPESGCAVSDYVLIAYDLFDGDEVYGKGISVGRLRRGGRGDATTEYWDSPSFDEIYEPPTHWMPLLAPPQAAPEQEGEVK